LTYPEIFKKRLDLNLKQRYSPVLYSYKGKPIMKKITFSCIIFLSFFLVTCGQDSSTTKRKKVERKYDKITLEKYVNYYKEADALLMEKFWPKLKGKPYSEGKDIYGQYKKEEKALLKKHNIEKFSDLQRFARKNYKNIREYRQKDPGYKKYPEMSAAKNQFLNYITKSAAGK